MEKDLQISNHSLILASASNWLHLNNFYLLLTVLTSMLDATRWDNARVGQYFPHHMMHHGPASTNTTSLSFSLQYSALFSISHAYYVCCRSLLGSFATALVFLFFLCTPFKFVTAVCGPNAALGYAHSRVEDVTQSCAKGTKNNPACIVYPGGCYL